MAKYKIIFEGEEEDEVFDSYEEADEYALYLVSCYHTGGEILIIKHGAIFLITWIPKSNISGV